MTYQEITNRLDKIQQALNELRLLAMDIHPDYQKASHPEYYRQMGGMVNVIYYKDPTGGYTTKRPQFREDRRQ